MKYQGDFLADSTVLLLFTTHDSAGAAVAPSTPFEAADVRIYKDGGAVQKTTDNGITMSSPFDAVVGLHQVAIDTSVDTGDAGFWVAGSDYLVVLAPDETVDTQTVVSVIGSFSIENRSTLSSAAVASAVGYDETTLVASIRADLERTGGDLDALETRLTALRAGYLDELAAVNLPADVAANSTKLTEINAKTINLPASPAAVGDIPSAGAVAAAVAYDAVALVASIRADMERLGGDLDTLTGRLNAVRAGYLDKLNVTGVLAHSDAAAVYKADAAAALIAYGGPTRAEATADKQEILARGDVAWLTYDGSDPAGVTTLLDRLSVLWAARLDAAVSSRSSHDAAAVVGAMQAVADSFKADVSGLSLEATVLLVQAATDRLDALLEDSGGDRFTAKALEAAPVAAGVGGGDATLAKQEEILAALAGASGGDATLLKQGEILAALAALAESSGVTLVEPATGPSFWESMQAGAESGIEVHEEVIVVGTRELMGVVDAIEVEQSLVLGGGKVMVGFAAYFTLAVGGTIVDGESASARGYTGKVLSRVNEGANWRIMVGPENRWDGDGGLY